MESKRPKAWVEGKNIQRVALVGTGLCFFLVFWNVFKGILDGAGGFLETCCRNGGISGTIGEKNISAVPSQFVPVHRVHRETWPQQDHTKYPPPPSSPTQPNRMDHTINTD